MNKISLIGLIFGNLTILADSGRRTKNGTIIWECRCDCGNISYSKTDNLKSGRASSCGKCNRGRYFEHPSGHMIGLTAQDVEFIFDKDDFNLISNYTWHKTKRGYIVTNLNGKLVPLHKILIKTNAEVDHKNHDKTDNRRFNLRECTHKQNMSNMPKFKTNKSGYKGVCYYKNNGQWLAQITHNYKSIKIGYFNNPIEAAIAYDKAAIKYFGEFANLNFQN